MQNSNYFKQVYMIVSRIPEGRVASYGRIAAILGTKDARLVGWALHKNKNPKIPCHRVVNKDGGVATNYAFGGWREQKMRLLSEGIKFKDETHIDLEKYLWTPKK